MAFNPTMIWTLRDNVTKKLNVMTNSTSRLDKALDKTFRNGNAGLSRMMSTAKGFIIGQGVVGGIHRVTGAVREMTDEWVAFDENAYFASSKWKEVTEGTITFNDALEKTKEISRAVGDQTRFTAGDVAASMDVMAMSNFGLMEANEKTMLSMGKFATLARSEMPEATKMLTSAMAAFGKEITDIEDFGNKMTNTYTRSKMELVDLAEATQKAGAIFHDMGQSEMVFNALAMQLAKIGMVGEEAGTKLRNALLVMTAKKKTLKELGALDVDVFTKTMKAMSEAGVEVTKGGKVRNFIDILSDLKEKTADLTQERQAKIFRNIFNLRDITAAKTLLSGIGEGGSLNKFYQMQFEHENKMENQYKRVSGSIAERFHILRSVLTDKVFSGAESARNPLSGFLKDMTGSIRDFDMKPINDWIATNVPGMFKWIKDTVIELMPEIIFLTKTFSQLTAKIIEFSPQIVKTVDALLKLGAVMWVGNLIVGVVSNLKLFGGIAIEIFGLLQYAGVALGYWFGGLSASAAAAVGVASGIGIVIAAVVTIVAVWKTWGDEITGWWDTVKYGWYMPFLGGLGLIFDIIVRSLNMWKRIITGFKDNGIVGSLEIIGKTILSQLLTPLDYVLKAMDKFGILSDGAYDSFSRFRAGLEGGAIEAKNIVDKNVNVSTDPNQFSLLNFGHGGGEGVYSPMQQSNLVAPNQSQVRFEKQQVEVLVNLKGETDKVDSVSSVGGEVAVNDLYGIQG